MKKPNHQLIKYPSSRIGTIDLGQIGLRKHHVAGLLEIDVTAALQRVRNQKAQGRPISFFAWMVKAVSTVVADNKNIQALLGRRNSLIVFDDIDISVAVERTVKGVRVPLALVIRNTDKKSAEAIYSEIKQAQAQEIRDESDYVPGENKVPGSTMKLFYSLPQRLRLFLLRRILRNPFRSKDMMGTAIITSVGSAGRLPSWIIPKAMHNLCFALGWITK